MRIIRAALLGAVAASLAGLGCSGPDEGEPSAAAPSEWTHPLTPWGEPDLQGMWPVDHINGTPLQRPESFGNRRYLTDEEYAERVARLGELNARYDDEIESNRMNMGHWVEMGNPNRLTSLIVEPENGRLPALTEAGRAKSATMKSSWSDIEFDALDDFNALDRCITRGMPGSMFPFMYNSGISVLQSPGVVVIRLELIHESRVIHVDGRPPLAPEIKHWLGESRGRWDGHTLVIETTNFNGETPMTIVGPGGNPIPTSESMRIVERLTRISDDTIEYEIEVEDPEMIAEPWKAAFPWQRDPGYRFFEYACHEDNHIVRDLIGTTLQGRR
jgi:hypothetical protein